MTRTPDDPDALYAEAVRVIAAALPRSTPPGYPKRAATALERAGLLHRAPAPDDRDDRERARIRAALDPGEPRPLHDLLILDDPQEPAP